jgi:asparagine synthase (glutamine-hydrolysing)
MCGLYLRICDGTKGKGMSKFDYQNVRQIEVRGPDKLTILEDSDLEIFYGFARLAIRSIKCGEQPWLEGRFTSAFNGEIYNTEHLKSKIRFLHPQEVIPESDTHLLALSLFLFGPKFISEVVGMYAGYLKIKNKLYLFRDRVGEKPLYYGFYENTFFISSSLPVNIFEDGEISKKTLISGLNEYKITNKISTLCPGSYIEVDIDTVFIKQNLVEHKYWVWPERNRFVNKSNMDSFEAVIKSSIESQLASDVGMSVLLSGGVDSGIVAAIARNLYGPSLESFTLTFKNSPYSEAKNAKITAEHLNLKNETIETTFEELAENVNQTLEAMDIPIFDTGALSLFLLCKKISSTQKVALTGDGGDELFRGYRIFNHLLALNILTMVPLEGPISNLIKYLDKSGGKKDDYLGFELKLKRARSINSNRGINPLFGAIGPLGGTELFDFICKQNSSEIVNGNKIITKKVVENYFINHVLPKIFLVKADRMSMCSGIELRAPLLDHRVIEVAFGFSELSINFKTRKHHLKKIATKYLPGQILTSSKHGFSTPFHQVVKFLEMPNWKSPTDEEEYDLFSKIWLDAKNGRESAGLPAWSLLVYEHFYKRYLKSKSKFN